MVDLVGRRENVWDSDPLGNALADFVEVGLEITSEIGGCDQDSWSVTRSVLLTFEKCVL